MSQPHVFWRINRLLIISSILSLFPGPGIIAQSGNIDQFNMIWNSESKNAGESMPCGGGDIGLNVWVENGDILFYIDRSGNIDENDQQLKSGRVRLRLDPNPFADPVAFRQELKLEQGYVEVESAVTGLKAVVKIWVEVRKPVIHVDVHADQRIKLQAFYENWRNTKRLVPRTLKPNGDKDSWDYNRWAMFGYFWYEGEVYTYPDHVEFSDRNSVLFYHRNTDDLIFDKETDLMRLNRVRDELVNPAKNRTFGGLMTGDGMVAGEPSPANYANTPCIAWELYSKKPDTNHQIRITLHTAQTLSLDEWKNGLIEAVKSSQTKNFSTWQDNLAWWKKFWDRSMVVIDPQKRDTSELPWQVGRNYQLFRYQLACNVFGEWPTRFNGGLFTFDPTYVDGRNASPAYYNPDFRAWGAWTAQNQRLVYWPMLKNGDFDVIIPQFEFYRKNLPNAVTRSREAWNIDGCSFCEQIGTGGLPLGSHYGWEPPFGTRDPLKETGLSDLHATYYTTQLEFAFMIHEWHRFNGGDLTPYLQFLKKAVSFNVEYFKMLQQRRTGSPYDDGGFLVFDPSHALETYHGKNATDLLCAIRMNLECLLALPDNWITFGEREQYADWIRRLPPLNFRTRSGHLTISPVAGDPNLISNYEAPQLYPVFPWPVYGIGRPDLQVAIDTWHYGLDVWTQGRKPEEPAWYPASDFWFGWTQQAIWLARMGLTEEARGYMVKKMSDARGNNDYNSKARARFPSFWGPGFDWTPDHNWGGSGMIAVQEMLMQTIDSSIFILPAWPKEWDVHFKLHAPYNTTVEVNYKNGNLETLTVTPQSREKDIILPSFTRH